jgi:hypothetical protein
MWRFGAVAVTDVGLPTAGTVQVLPMLCIGKTPEHKDSLSSSQKSLVSEEWDTGGFRVENARKTKIEVWWQGG